MGQYNFAYFPAIFLTDVSMLVETLDTPFATSIVAQPFKIKINVKKKNIRIAL